MGDEKPKVNEALLEQRYRRGTMLAEKWSKMEGAKIRGYEGHGMINFLEGIEDDVERANLALLYENTYHWLNNELDESTRMVNVGPFEKFVFPILRAMMANLVANELVTVSPLEAPTGLVFYFDVLYGSNKGNITRGTKMYDVRRGPARDYHYTDEIVKEEQLAVGDGGVAYAGNLGYNPVRPGTVVITDGAQRITDNGNGALIGDIGVGANTVNYNTGAVVVNFAGVVANGDAITVDYEYNSEGRADIAIPEIDLQLTSAPITARKQALRARWSLEAQQDFQAYHGINAEVELVTFMANELAKELNYKIIDHIYQVASAGAVTWDRSPAAGGVPWIWHKESLYDALIQQSNTIFEFTQRAQGNWIVASIDVCNVIEVLSKFQKTGTTSTSVAGVRKIGTLGDFTVYKDPRFPAGEWLMGYKGSSFLDTGYIHAPYLQVYTTNTIVLDDMLARKAMAMRTGQKVVNAGMYSRGTLIQSGNPF